MEESFEDTANYVDNYGLCGDVPENRGKVTGQKKVYKKRRKPSVPRTDKLLRKSLRARQEAQKREAWKQEWEEFRRRSFKARQEAQKAEAQKAWTQDWLRRP